MRVTRNSNRFCPCGASPGRRSRHPVHHHFHHHLHHRHALLHHLMVRTHVASHPLHAFHVAHASVRLHHFHAVLHGFHVFGHQLAALFMGLGAHHFFVHVAHGLHLRVHPGHGVGCSHAVGGCGAHGHRRGRVAGDQGAGGGEGNDKWNKSKMGHDRLPGWLSNDGSSEGDSQRDIPFDFYHLPPRLTIHATSPATTMTS